MVVKRRVMGQGVRDVSAKEIESFAPGIGTAITSGTPLPEGARFVPSTSGRNGAWFLVLGNTAIVAMMLVFTFNLGRQEDYNPWLTPLVVAFWLGVLVWRPYVELRGRPRLGLYVTPEVLVIHRGYSKGTTIAPRASVIDVHATEDRLPARAAVSITAWTPRETRTTKNYGTVDLPRDELDVLLHDWWHRAESVSR